MLYVLYFKGGSNLVEELRKTVFFCECKVSQLITFIQNRSLSWAIRGLGVGEKEERERERDREKKTFR